MYNPFTGEGSFGGVPQRRRTKRRTLGQGLATGGMSYGSNPVYTEAYTESKPLTADAQMQASIAQDARMEALANMKRTSPMPTTSSVQNAGIAGFARRKRRPMRTRDQGGYY